jgi:hypothetical protein
MAGNDRELLDVTYSQLVLVFVPNKDSLGIPKDISSYASMHAISYKGILNPFRIQGTDCVFEREWASAGLSYARRDDPFLFA